MFGRFATRTAIDILLRTVVGILAAATLFHPSDNVALVCAVATLGLTVLGVRRHRLIAPPKSGFAPQPAI
jgi:hypothetical protein